MSLFVSLVLAGVANAAAAGGSDTMAVTVTVVRSCPMVTHALDQGSSSGIACSSGQHLVSTGEVFQVNGGPGSSASGGFRTVTLNF